MKEIANALQEVRDLLEKIHSAYSDSQGDISIYQLRKTISVVNSALAKPLRNCDVGDAEEQFARFKKWCEGKFYKRPMNALTDEPCKSCPCYSVAVNGVDGCNYLRWAQMLYEKKEGEK